MLPLDHPDRIHVAVDDHRLVANAGLLLPVTLGLCQLVDRHVDLGDAPGRANTAVGMQGVLALVVTPAATDDGAAGVAVVQRRRNSCSRRSVEICTMVGRPWGQQCGSGVSANCSMMDCI